jgi:hypothetical protein
MTRTDSDCGCSYLGERSADTDSLLAKSPFGGDFFANGHEHVYIPFPEGFIYQNVPDPVQLTPIRPSEKIGDLGSSVPYPMGMAMPQRLQVCDIWNPNQQWGGGYGQNPGDRDGTYLTIGAQEHAPLEFPRYSYAAIDTEKLLEEAEARVAARFQAFDL